MIKCLQLCVAISLLSAAPCSLHGQTPDDSTFYSPVIGTELPSFTSSGGDDSAALSSLIASLSSAGGVVNIGPGDYRLRGVQLKSNVHLRIDPGATIRPTLSSSGNQRSIFLASDNAAAVSNFSVEGVGGGSFKFDLTELPIASQIRAIQFENAENFRVANVHIADNLTEFSSFAFSPNLQRKSTPDGSRIDFIRGVSSRGIIENASVTGAHYGYGLVQVQSGNNLMFRNLSATGGLTLRLETGSNVLQFADEAMAQTIRLDNIYGRNLESINGQAAVTLSPHTLDQGTVDIAGVRAFSSETGVKWAAGFVSDRNNDENGQVAAGLTPGSFASDSIIRDVEVTFGQNAQLHPSIDLRFLPCELRTERVNGIGISGELDVTGESRIGPSISSVSRRMDAPGDYLINFAASEVTAIGFNINEYQLPENAIIGDAFDDYEHCSEVVDGVNFFVPRELRGTPNRRVFAVPEPGSGILLATIVSIHLLRRRKRIS